MQTWEALGRPTLFLNNSITNGLAVLRFLWRRDYSALGDRGFARFASFLRCYMAAYFVLFVLFVVVFMTSSGSHSSGGMAVTPQPRLDDATKKLAAARTQEEKFYALNDAAKESFVAGKVEDAGKYAQELMRMLPDFQGNWNYGNAVQDANLVLGRIAVREGHIDKAKRHLIASGNSPGSPQMDSFGPNMSLAKDLLEKGEHEAVLEYFELCRKFWNMDNGKLNDWSQEVKAGRIPDFGANLVY
ncbi:MAG TPA: hypothetical protein VN578_14095 [Candidatus Binatia bacterium]|nr:hypothetical protein [Candidatus Binatia bacterium]